MSRTPEEARARVLQLYRDWYRSVRSFHPFRPARAYLHACYLRVGTRNRFYLCFERDRPLLPPAYTGEV